jgi:EAL domain-containing protein (putative c-di-GMP-specific phosphodiesterase class I)
VVASITTLASELDGVVVAEGAEAEDDFDVLRRLGVDLVQGFAVGRPVPSRTFSAQQRLPRAS